MKTLKVLLQEVVSGIKAWVNSNFAQESNAVHKTGNETINGVKTFTGATYKNSLTAYENSGVSGYDYTPGSFKSVDTFIHRGVDHVYWGGLKHNWLSDGTSQTRFAVSNYKYANNTWNQGFWAVDLSASRDFATVELVPSVNYGINLGSSTLQWNSVYAKNYYYNGTAWGLEQRNVWTNDNCVKNPYYALGQTPTVTSGRYLLFTDYYNQNLGWVHHRISSTGISSTELYAANKFTNSQLDTNGTTQNAILKLGINSDASTFLDILATDVEPWPGSTNVNLGTSTNKFKTLNGINPGALSLPNSPGGTGVENVNYYDLSGNITVRDGSGENKFTASCDGWIAIGSFATWLQISNDTLLVATTANPGADGFAQGFLPVRAGNSIRILINQTSTQFQSFKLLPCQGNV